MPSQDLSIKISARNAAKTELDALRKDFKDLQTAIRKATDPEQARALEKALDAVDRRMTDVTGTLRRANLEVGRAEGQAHGLGRAWQWAGGQISKHAQGIRNAGLIGGAAMLLLAKNSLTARSSVEDAESALNATFKRSGANLVAWAKSNADAYNLSQVEALTSLQRFAGMADGAQLKGRRLESFAVRMTRRSADMASYTGGTTEEALASVVSGLSGEQEPLRRYNVFLSETAVKLEAVRMGLIRKGKDMTEAQKIEARGSLIMKLSASQAGDVARTQDSMANTIKDSQQQWADMNATLGENVAIGAGPLLRWVSKGLKLFQLLPAPVRTTMLVVAALGIAAMIATPKILMMNAALAQMRTASLLANQAVGTSAAGIGAFGRVGGFLAASGGPLAAITLGLGLAATAWGMYQSAQANAKADADAIGTSLDKTSGKATKATRALIANKLASTMDPKQLAALSNAGVTPLMMAKAVINGGAAQAKLQHRLEVYRQWGAMNASTEGGRNMVGAIDKARNEMGYQTSALTTATGAWNPAAPESKAGRARARELAGIPTLKQAEMQIKASIDPKQLEVAKLTTSDPVAAKYLATTAQATQKTADGLEGMPGFMKQMATNTYGPPIKGWDPATGRPEVKKALGGLVVGPGSGTSDSIAARLSNGEYVLRAAAVRGIGTTALDRLNVAGRLDQVQRVAALPTALLDRTQIESPVQVDASSPSGPLVGHQENHFHSGFEFDSHMLALQRHRDREQATRYARATR